MAMPSAVTQSHFQRTSKRRRLIRRSAKMAILAIGIFMAGAFLRPRQTGIQVGVASRHGRSLLAFNETAVVGSISEGNHTCAEKLEALGFNWEELDHLDINKTELLAKCTHDVVEEFRDINVGGQNITLPWETCDFERDNLKPLFVTLYVLIILILFIGLAIICDDFFVPSLEAISEKLDLSEDVAGATFMAAGSSAPELFTSVASVGVTSDVGVGTIVGSAVFNLLMIIALTALLAGQVLHLDWRPVIRDSFFYTLSIGAFIVFSWDGLVQHYEAAILLSLYILYVVIMKFNKHVMKCLGKCSRPKVSPLVVEEASPEFSEENIPVAAFAENKQVANIKVMNFDSSRRASVAELHNHRFAHLHGGELSGSFANHPQRSNSMQSRLSLSLHAISSSESQKTTRSQSTRRKSSRLIVPNNDASKPRKNFGLEDSQATRSMPSWTAPPENQRSGLLPAIIRPKAPLPVSITPVETFAAPEDDDAAVTKAQSEFGSQISLNSPVKKEEPASDADEDEDSEQSMRPIACFPRISIQIPSNEKVKAATTCCSRTFQIMKLVYKWIMFCISFPFMCLFTWTVPPCSKPKHRKYFLLSFTMSILWIFTLSFGVVAIVGRVGCLLHIDEYTMGLVVVAIGTSIPDALSSILVARDGFGDMAVSNAIGSNIFDINLGIGLPYAIRIMIEKGKPVLLLSPVELLAYRLGFFYIIPHAKFGFILLLILLIALAVFIAVGFKLNRVISVIFIVIYACFLFYAFYQDIHCRRGRLC